MSFIYVPAPTVFIAQEHIARKVKKLLIHFLNSMPRVAECVGLCDQMSYGVKLCVFNFLQNIHFTAMNVIAK